MHPRSMMTLPLHVIYDELINYNGYINVHNSATDLGPLVVQGNIGSNG